MNFERQIEASVEYLGSPEALRAVDADAYWPKWDAPWWHMLLLHEMGETARIPRQMVERYIASLDRMPLKIFPIRDEDLPAGIDPFRGTSCHCQLGNVYQVLSAYGVNVDQELPWLRPWFLRYQMPDGGLNCDNEAYLVTDECPSSMVGTIAVFEAVLMCTPRAWTAEETRFLEKGAKFLMDRQLRRGSSSNHNADERKSAESWTQLCFPRYYFYDVLRGLNALTLWAEKTGRPLPAESIAEVLELLRREFPDGEVRIGRLALEGTGTLWPEASGQWSRGHAATFFPLLEKVSEVGSVSPYLSRQWREVEARLSRLGFLGSTI